MAWIGEIDLGTKPAPMTGPMVSLTIDDQTVQVPEGTSIMRAAAIMGTSIPKLCATDTLESFGSCRLCLVEIDGELRTAAEQSHA
jgi:formate dehydrogenase major subunit